MEKVAVTGASGHIGANLVRELLARGYRVVCLVRGGSRALQGLDVEQVRGDVLDGGSLRQAFAGVRRVFHLAAHISIGDRRDELLKRVNVEGTANVIAACRSTGAGSLVHFSSIHALAPAAAPAEVTENSPLAGAGQNGGGEYDRSKAAADRLVRDAAGRGLDTRIIYPTAVIGPNDYRASILGQVIVKLARGNLPALVPGGFDWVDVRDVAWGAVEAAEKGADGSRFILSGHYLEVPALAEVIAQLTGVPAPAFKCPAWLARLSLPFMALQARLRGDAPMYTRYSLATLSSRLAVSHELATRELGYRPRPLRETITDALRFYRDEGHLPAERLAD